MRIDFIKYLFFICFSLTSCFSASTKVSVFSNFYTVKEKSSNFLIFGDSGTGKKWQHLVAKSMKKTCSIFGCDFALLLGDNFYQEGVESIRDRQFIDKFEKPYNNLTSTIYAVLGNHDYGHGQKGIDAQISYSNYSDLWSMPNRYYHLDFSEIEIIALDTQNFDLKQRHWLVDKLSKPRKKWRIIVAHHPIYAYGGHGPNERLQKILLPNICGRVDGYFAGHEHNLQYLEAPCVQSNSNKNFDIRLFVSGAAAKLRTPERGKFTKFYKKTRGYLLAKISKGTLSVDFINTARNVLHTVTLRSSKQKVIE
jgi:tartrate-resistant acid phosphatase type 5